jgi:hypothetical protein
VAAATADPRPERRSHPPEDRTDNAAVVGLHWVLHTLAAVAAGADRSPL